MIKTQYLVTVIIDKNNLVQKTKQGYLDVGKIFPVEQIIFKNESVWSILNNYKFINYNVNLTINRFNMFTHLTLILFYSVLDSDIKTLLCRL